MADETMTLLDVVRKGQEPGKDFLREAVRWMVHELMNAEVTAQIGAGRYERTDERTTQRNGYRTRSWDTRVGTIGRATPKLRTGSYFPTWLEPRKRSEQPLVSVVVEADVRGVSTRKVEALVQTLGSAGLGKSEVSRLCAALDAQVGAFRTRRLDAVYSYLCLDAGDSAAVRANVAERGYAVYVRSRGQERADKVADPDARARRWVVERTHSWLNHSRRLLVRREKKLANHVEFVHLACARLIFHKILVPG